MIKRSYFDQFDGPGWPEPKQLERFFIAPRGQEWSYKGGNDSWGLSAEGLNGTENLPFNDQSSVDLSMIGNSDHGVYLWYSKWDGRLKRKSSYAAKGDLSRLVEFVESLHGDPLSIGLFVPFPMAWKAVKEFIERDGELPKSIEWLRAEDIPPEAFPDPGAPR